MFDLNESFLTGLEKLPLGLGTMPSSSRVPHSHYQNTTLFSSFNFCILPHNHMSKLPLHPWSEPKALRF